MSAPPLLPPYDLSLDLLPSVDLFELNRVAELQERFDGKYVVKLARLPDLLSALGPQIHVLEVSGRRTTDYTSTYFDTTDLRTYRDHVQRRRRRFKVRTRHYGEPGLAMLELKCKGRRGSTVKHRWPHPGDSPEQLGPVAESLLRAALELEYGMALPSRLRRSAVNRFERVTLVDMDAGERLTIDLGLTVQAKDRVVHLGTGYAVVETKSPCRRGRAGEALLAMGLRPMRVSKYCLGVAASNPHVRGNPWKPALRRLAA